MVSIIVPVYNAEKFIRRCIDSIIGQTIQDIEVILVNDGSLDKSLSIMQEYAERDTRVKIISQENKGVAAARNTGLSNATREYFLYVDADDWLESNAIECLLKRMYENIDIVVCDFDHAETLENVRRERQVELEEWNNERQLYEFVLHKRMAGMLWNKLIRRSIAEDIVFNEKTGYGEDAEFLWNVLKKSRKMCITNEILYHHVLEVTSISHKSYSEKKYSAIPMWEKINSDVEKENPKLMKLAKISLTSAAVYGMFEAHQNRYHNLKHISHMRSIVRKNIFIFLQAKHISVKFKLYAIAVCIGY